MTQAWARALGAIAPLAGQPSLTLAAIIDEMAATHGRDIALEALEALEELGALEAVDHVLTYQALAGRKNQYARWAIGQGLRAGQHVCLFMRNCPDYVAIWLGLTQIGVVVALINTHLEGDALAHAIGCSTARHILADRECLGKLQRVHASLGAEAEIWCVDDAAHADDTVKHLATGMYDDATLDRAATSLVASTDPALLIFTSGTTGLPKAAVLSHYRILEWSYWFAGMMNTSAIDRLYNCLPLYHSTGGVAALGAVLVRGGRIVLRAHFSASRFWPDIEQSGCTIFLYIGELCRYLTNATEPAGPVRHTLRLCCGNGLRADVWTRFTARFAIPHILEFYAATEGNVSLYNYDGPPGALGRVPPYLAHRFPLALLAHDPDTGAPRRSADGRYMRCEPGEAGEAIGRITYNGPGRPGAFEGYTDAAATSGKILRDVFSPGDAWFRTGDLMRKDRAGYIYFVDRLGDTFRWKGENVSTTEVGEAIASCPGVTGAVVYGVAVPGADGRAGMAAITIEDDFDVARLYEFVESRLPAYARPQFLRVCEHLQTTATFKPIKVRLVSEGTDLGASGDLLYVQDAANRIYRLAA